MITESTTVHVSLRRQVLFFAIGLLTLINIGSSSIVLADDFFRDFNKTLNQTNRTMQRLEAERRRQQAQEEREIRRQKTMERWQQVREARERRRQERMERRRQEAERQRQIYESMTPEEQATYVEKRRRENALIADIIGAAILGGNGSASASGGDTNDPSIRAMELQNDAFRKQHPDLADTVPQW